MSEIFHVRSTLGDSRPATVHPGDGFPWISCPFCGSAIYLEQARPEHAGIVGDHGRCNNGWCVANPKMPIDEARAIRGAAMCAELHEQARARDHAAALQRIDEDRARRSRVQFFASLTVVHETEGERRWFAVPSGAPGERSRSVALKDDAGRLRRFFRLRRELSKAIERAKYEALDS